MADTTSVLSGIRVLATVPVAGSPVGSYAITATNGTLSATNYSFSFVNGTLAVGQATLTVSANNTNRHLWRDQSGVHGELHRLCKRGHDERIERSPGLATSAVAGSPGGLCDHDDERHVERDELSISLLNGTLTV